MSRPQVVILSTAHPAGDGRIRRWVNGFAEADADVTVVALGSPSGGGSPFAAEVHLRSLAAVGRSRRLLRAITLPLRHRADLVVAIDPELYGPVLLMQRMTRGRAVADVHEDFGQLASDHDRWGPRAIRRLIGAGAALTTFAASRFDATVVADHHLKPMAAQRRIVGRNVAEPSDFDRSTERYEDLHAVYAGDLTPQRGLNAMLEGLVMSPDWRLDLFGPDRVWAREAIMSAADRSDGRIRYRGQLPHAQLVAELPKYHVGLSLLHPIPSYAAAMPSKIYEYQAAGLASITSALPRAAALVRDTDSGIVLDDEVALWPVRLADTLRYLGTDPGRLARYQQNAADAVQSAGPQSDGLPAAVRSLTDLLG